MPAKKSKKRHEDTHMLLENLKANSIINFAEGFIWQNKSAILSGYFTWLNPMPKLLARMLCHNDMQE